MRLQRNGRRAACAMLNAMMSIGLCAAAVRKEPRVFKPVYAKTADGELEGIASDDGKVRIFRGIPYAAPPVGALRWKAPQPAASWTGVRKAVEYGARCMQNRVFDDMVFRDNGPSEDCLYLNIWAPTTARREKLPVMAWIYGGGFVAGSTSEPRQDGEHLSKKGVMVVSFNYRLDVFGFFSHPELVKESGRNAAGNYGLLDQVAALQWIKKNIAAFGGDPENVTIFGESAGSFSVSALIASPLAKGLFHRAIGESGAFFGTTLQLKPLAETEKADLEFTKTSLGTTSIDTLRAKPADEILKASAKERMLRFTPNIDGYFLPQDVGAIYAGGRQSPVSLLAGWNADEGEYQSIFGKDPPTAQNFQAYVRRLFGTNAEAFLKLYPALTDAEARRSAQDLAGDQFIAYPTWKWLEMQHKTGKSLVYRYRFDQTLPWAADYSPKPGEEPTAPHAAEIEYVFGMLSSRRLPWRPEDRKVSDLMGSYWTNFARTGDPNSPGLPRWPVYSSQDGYQVMHLSATSRALPDQQRARYVFLDNVAPLK
jgi:para-nitrobenzyl esterase